MKLLLIRHAKMAGDPYVCPARPVTGCLSADVGLPQARALAEALRGERIDVAFCSPYGRALQTAEIVLQGRSTPIHIVDGLREWIPNPSLRDAPSTVFEEMMKRDSARFAEDTWKTEQGEGCYDVYARVIPPFLEALAGVGVRARHGGFVVDGGAGDLTIAVFAHGGSLNVMLSQLLGVRPFPIGAFAFAETGVAALEFSPRQGVHYPVLRIPTLAPRREQGP